jgi:hypothetical protein
MVTIARPPVAGLNTMRRYVRAPEGVWRPLTGTANRRCPSSVSRAQPNELAPEFRGDRGEGQGGEGAGVAAGPQAPDRGGRRIGTGRGVARQIERLAFYGRGGRRFRLAQKRRRRPARLLTARLLTARTTCVTSAPTRGGDTGRERRALGSATSPSAPSPGGTRYRPASSRSSSRPRGPSACRGRHPK